MLSRLVSRVAAPRTLGVRAMSSTYTYELNVPCKSHNCDGPSTTTSATKEEMEGMLDLMVRMRRMEVSFDNEYKARNIRGFCHLYDGQEAIAVGIENALSRKDSWITSYRCHATMLARGGSVEAIAAELFGFKAGVSDGKGGSMHLYSKEENFYGGAGIVGAQVPAGVGLAFANKYNAGGTPPYDVAIMGYGDGAANQGQIWEVANMAALWKLPAIFLCENNQYGMGTSVERHSSNPEYYTMGNKIPGVWADGMDVLSMREAVKYCKEHCAAGNGPIFLEASTYRYHGHSMSDPGITYRDRDEVSNTRSTRDPIECLKNHMIDAGFATPEELKAVEKRIRKEVAEEMKKAKESGLPEEDGLYSNIFSSGARDVEACKEISEIPDYIRTVDITKSLKSSKAKY